MLSIGLFVNGREIDRVDLVNQCKKNKKGETLYLLNNKFKIWHKREDGARVLAKKSLDYLISHNISKESELYDKVANMVGKMLKNK